MRFRLIDAAKKDFPVQRLCKVLGVSPSGYFAWKDRPACRRQRDDMVLLAHVRSAFAVSNGTYGSPRMMHELRDNGLAIGRRRTARLMRENGLKARQKRRFKRTTDSLHAFPVAPNLLDQDFAATGPNQKWGSDISYVWTREGWLYLATRQMLRICVDVIDLFARRVVGWATSDRLHKELALSALRRAIAVRRPSAGLIHHADRGRQYCSIEYQAELRNRGILISMSGKGNCYDNAMVETFFKTLKAELVWRTVFQTRAEATTAIGRYIDGFYNPVRRHSALTFISPLQFERQAASMKPIRAALGATVVDPKLLTSAELLQYEGYLRREETNVIVAELAASGASIKEIVRRTGRSRKLVRMIVRGERTDIFRTRQGSLDPHLPFLDAQWEAGCRNGAELWRRLRALGLGGLTRVVREWATRRRRSEQMTATQLRKVPSARTIASLMTLKRDHLTKAETLTVAAIEDGVPALAEARTLIDRFQSILRRKAMTDLDPWLRDAEPSLIASFVRGITKDIAAVRAAVTEPWSNGQTEGHVNRLKLVKRQMYGRAKIDLLEARLLGAP